MKKFLLVLGALLIIVGIIFATPLLGRDKSAEDAYYGSAYAGEGGGGGI